MKGHSKGTLKIKVVKEDDIVEIYAYCDEESNQAMTPFAVFSGCYFAGHLDVGLLHSGAPSSMSIESISVRNLDAVKGQLVTVDENDRVELSYEKPDDGEEVPGGDGQEPGGNENPGGNEQEPGGNENPGEGSGCGCGSNVAGSSIIIGLSALAAAVFVIVKKSANKKD